MGSCTSKDSNDINTATKPSNTQARRNNQRSALQQQQQSGSSNNIQHNPSSDSSNVSDKQQSNNTSTTNGTAQIGNGSATTSASSPLASAAAGGSNGVTSIQQQLSSNPVSVAAEQSQSDSNEIKILLLGSGESGKSTVVKQMKILHQNGYSKSELQEYKPFVYKNILDCIKNVINAIIDLQPELINKSNDSNLINDQEVEQNEVDSVEKYEGKGLKKHVLEYDDLNEVLDYDFSIDSEQVFNPDIAKKIKQIYNTPEVQYFIKFQQGNFYLIDSTDYLLSDIDRITNPDYLPSVNDILRTRKKTSGIFDFRFQMGRGLNIHMYDVGGQRSERKKWIHCFDNVTLIIFCVALSEYDQTLLEESTQNRLEESLALFDSVVNSRWFTRTSVVLFLNKIDVFEKKLPYSPLKDHFPDYTGGDNVNKAAKYILWRFNQVNRSGLNIYPHVTQATDTSNIVVVMANVREAILNNSLSDIGILPSA
ncbi:guanine nucleotide binding protein, alpha subunit [Scheffersomyces coipomensis]|uniref:guanine nucleotide binding protein, alpha subunit n=1 Tax=Scheffersomyces coipomensis TaxID=1788519 RepID=UPI00315D0E41